ncbi:MAG: galactose mutarotase [Propionibacteriaceae bacterium]|nr:galactose mutarotase [Propionibacteriaceae bacterium]
MSQYELRNDHLWATIDTLGAALSRLRVRRGDGWRDLALSSAEDAYMGRTVGRFANRLAGGRFSIDGVGYQVSVNEPPNTLHGGADGFSDRQWEVVAADDHSLALRLVSPDGDQGFPGALEAAAAFDLGEHALTLTYAATCDAPTIVNLTLHPYFDLGAGGIDELQLWVNAPQYTPTRADGIPTGEVLPVSGGLDFLAPRQVGTARAAMLAAGQDRGGAMDHNFMVPGAGLREMVRLSGDGLTLTVLSDAPAVQVYDAAGFAGLAHGPDGQPYEQHAGLAIEPQSPPDAPNQPGFSNTVLRPGETWSRVITFLVS